MKICSKCGIEKDESDFPTDKSIRSGIKAHCKKCAYEMVRQWSKKNARKIPYSSDYYYKNKERIKANQKRSYEKRKAKHYETCRKWEERNRLKMREYHKDWNRRNREKDMQRQRAYRAANPEMNKRWKLLNAEKVLNCARKAVANLKPAYLKCLLRAKGLSNEAIDKNPELLTIQKGIILIKRHGKETNKHQKSESTGSRPDECLQ